MTTAEEKEELRTTVREELGKEKKKERWTRELKRLQARKEKLEKDLEKLEGSSYAGAMERLENQLQVLGELNDILLVNRHLHFLSSYQKKVLAKVLLFGDLDEYSKNFCKNCNECYFCKEPKATNLFRFKPEDQDGIVWTPIDVCLCKRCLAYVRLGKYADLYKILEKKGIHTEALHCPNGSVIPVFRREKDV